MTSIADARSDTVTKPTSRMREAMASCDVGDDVMNEDPTLHLLEARVAKLLNFEKALFFPTGTMANLTAIMSWCDGRNLEMIVGNTSHIFYYECGGAAHIAGVSTRPLPNEPDGTLKLGDIMGAIRPANVHFPVTRLVALENTQNFCGGRLLPDGYIQNVATALQDKNIKLHLDGARIWNAAVAAGKSVSELVAGVDSMSVCMSKGLGAPVGSLLVGPSDFIDRARFIRKSLGGGMRQAGVLAAACLVALDDYEAGEMIPRDHEHARIIAEGIAADSIRAFHVDVSMVDSNIVVVHLTEHCVLPVNEVVGLLKEQGVLVSARDPKAIRVVTHRDLSREHIDRIIDGFRVISQNMTPS